jgi:hypothetical protein
MAKESIAWWESPPEDHAYYGAAGEMASGYHTIDPRCSLLIGDLGFDMPLALDYGVLPDGPRVMYLPSNALGWIEVASDVSAFLSMIHQK